MVWQDLVFAGGGFVLTAGLVPMLRSAERPPVRTSLTLLAVLLSYVVALASLGLWLSAAGTALQAAVWGVFAVQRMQAARRARLIEMEPVAPGPAGGDPGHGYAGAGRDGDERL